MGGSAPELEITIISAKHLKNVNWRNGDLRPYATFWFNYNYDKPRNTTKVDNSNSTKPVWDEHFVIGLPFPPYSTFLKLEIRHNAQPLHLRKHLVGTLLFKLKDLPDPENSNLIRKFDLTRPSGRPNGKIHLKLAFPESALSYPPVFIPPEVAKMGGWIEVVGPRQETKLHLTHPRPPYEGVPPEALYQSWSWTRPLKSDLKESPFKVKELEGDDEAIEKLEENPWYYKLKKLLHVFNIKKQKGPTDPLVKGLLM